MGTRRDEKKNSRGTFVYSMEAKAARDEARTLVEEARKIRDELLGPRPAPVEAKAIEAPVAVEAPAEPVPSAVPAEPAPGESPKEVAPPQGA